MGLSLKVPFKLFIGAYHKQNCDMRKGVTMIYDLINKLVHYAEVTGLVEASDKDYAINRLLELFQLEEYRSPEDGDGQKEDTGEADDLEELLGEMLDYAFAQGILKENSIAYRDLFDTRIMGLLVPPPSKVIESFHSRYVRSPREATEFYYKFSQDTDYIRRYRIIKDIRWTTQTPYGAIDITINLSKPEKDPKAIAAARLAKQSGYPKCLLCKENVGYAGRPDHPARQNHRIIPITLQGQEWGLQYSPYVYYNEHCIVFNNKHIPMQIDGAAFLKMLDFVKQFPHYFIGSNADLPIVGGSILSHEHFQGGNYEFAMAKAPVERSFTPAGFEDVEAGVVSWPMSVIRLRSKSDVRLAGLAEVILNKWRAYTDSQAGIYAETEGEPHNTITPVARIREGCYELDLVLRNNLTTKEYPLGVFHPHGELHHIKKENIGVIEVMGLAILPARLREEMELLKEYILEGRNPREHELLAKHADWAEEFIPSYPRLTAENIDRIFQDEIGKVFLNVLEHAGVYKRTPAGQAAFNRFINTVK